MFPHELFLADVDPRRLMRALVIADRHGLKDEAGAMIRAMEPEDRAVALNRWIDAWLAPAPGVVIITTPASASTPKAKAKPVAPRQRPAPRTPDVFDAAGRALRARREAKKAARAG